MAPTPITSVLLKNFVTSGYPHPDRDFEIRHSELDIERADIQGGVVVKTLYVSVDPYQRPLMSGKGLYAAPYKLGEPLYSDSLARVVRSESAKFPVGTLVHGYFRWQTYSIVSDAALHSGMYYAIPNQYQDKLPLSAWIGPAGMTGRTAYYGFVTLAKPQSGETLFVSAASGAVGQIVGGLAVAKGLKVIGAAGSDEKVKYLVDELGFDPATFNYKTVRTRDALKKWLDSLGREGLDIYFDNVGGEMLDDVLESSAKFARIICCGSVSQYNVEKEEDRYRLKNYHMIVAQRLDIKGFLINDDRENRIREFLDNVPALLADKSLKWRETKTVGIENAPQALLDMLKGKNLGKAIVAVSEDEQ